MRGTDVLEDAAMPKEAEKRKSGIPTGNAGEYSVMGDPLRRGFGMIAQVIAAGVSDVIKEIAIDSGETHRATSGLSSCRAIRARPSIPAMV